jgi:regulator of cell morphogenesis and NO signaling
MLMDATRTVRELAIAVPNATRVFEKVKIDYCCGGNQPISQACEQAGIDVEEVFRLLDQASPTTSGLENVETSANNPKLMPLTDLSKLIVDKHHVFTRNELERLTALFDKVCSVHGQNHPELLEIKTVFLVLRDELEPHMAKEECVLFPYIARLEAAAAENLQDLE